MTLHLICLCLLATVTLTITPSWAAPERSVSNSTNTSSRATDPESVCKPGATVCKNCTSMGMCININGQGWQILDAGKCPADQTCLDGKCVTGPNPVCNPIAQLAFLCPTTGMFPNQVDCQRYHYCVKTDPTSEALTMYDESCTGRFAYNSLYKDCRTALSNDVCSSYPVPSCKSPGEMGALRENPSLYYICIIYPSPPTDPGNGGGNGSGGDSGNGGATAVTTVSPGAAGNQGKANFAPASEQPKTGAKEGETPQTLYPMIQVCPNGKSFNTASKRCNT